jgi:hypothetical protein
MNEKHSYFSTMPTDMLERLLRKDGVLRDDKAAIGHVLRARREEERRQKAETEAFLKDQENRRGKRTKKSAMRGSEYIVDRAHRPFPGGAVRPK